MVVTDLDAQAEVGMKIKKGVWVVVEVCVYGGGCVGVCVCVCVCLCVCVCVHLVLWCN